MRHDRYVAGCLAGFIEMLIDTLSAGIWNTISAPDPSNANNAPMPSTALFGVSCALTTTCVVVGRYLTTRVGGDAGAGLIDTFSDGRWSAAEAPLPADAQPERLSSIERRVMHLELGVHHGGQLQHDIESIQKLARCSQSLCQPDRGAPPCLLSPTACPRPIWTRSRAPRAGLCGCGTR